MNAKGIDQAADRLEVMIESHKTFMESSDDISAQNKSWVQFLLNQNSAFSKIQQFSKQDPKLQKWFNDVSDRIKEDRILQYLHQARNSE